MNPLISIVIPVYNVEKYLRECLNSVINQSYTNLEIICVNDCSTDSCPQILEEYAKNDPRIVILKNKENLGLGLSRNEGIKIAKGEFIHCLDSDDWMKLNAYETLAKYLDNSIDGIRFTYKSIDNQTGETKHIDFRGKDFLYKKINIYNTPECFRDWNSSAWIKILRKDFIIENNLFYNDYRCLEDIEYAMRAAIKAKNLVFIEDSLLCYRANRKGSLLTRRAHYIENIVKDTRWANETVKTLPAEVKQEILNYIYELLVMNCLDAFYVNVLPFKEMQSVFQNNIDFEWFTIPLASKLAKKALAYSEPKFFLSYNVRRFIREHFPKSTEKYFELKKRILAWTKKSA